MKKAAVKFGAYTDVHFDIMHDGKKRIEAFLRAADEADVDFIIHLGDFCYPKHLGIAPEAILPVNLKLALEKPPIQPGKDEMLERVRNYPKPSYFVLGNHDMDFCSKQDAMEAYGMEAPYYSFRSGGWHFIVLDGNHYRDGNGMLKDFGFSASYYRDIPYLGSVQLEWLKKELESGDEPTVIFCHQPLYKKGRELRDLAELRAILDQAKARGKKIRLCMNGHLHIDDLHVEGGTVYHSLNSISNYWAGEKYETLRYSEQIDRDYPSLRYTFPYEKPVFAIVTLTEDELIIDGRYGAFVQPGADKLGYRPRRTSCVRSHHLKWPE